MDSGAKIGEGGSTYTPTADITLTAHWKDAEPPIIHDDPAGHDVNGSVEYDWVRTSRTISYTARDLGAGMKKISMYTYDTGDADGDDGRLISENECTVSYTVTREGITKYKVVAEDNSGNKSTLIVTVKVDNTAPVGNANITYDGYNLNVGIDGITESMSGCKEAHITLIAEDETGSILESSQYDIPRTSATIYNGASFGVTIPLSDVVNYDSSKMTVRLYISDNVDNSRGYGNNAFETFYLDGRVMRTQGPASEWKAGEAGDVYVETGSHIDQLDITYPTDWTALDATLGTHTRALAGAYDVYNVEPEGDRELFYIPLRADNAQYQITVTATKNGHVKTKLLDVVTNGNIIADLKYRIRSAGDGITEYDLTH